MCQNSSSYDIVNMYRYKVLCKLYSKYKNDIKTVLENVYNDDISDCKINELDVILKEIEKYPISWKFYNEQDVKFSSDFEHLIVFTDDIKISNILTD